MNSPALSCRPRPLPNRQVDVSLSTRLLVVPLELWQGQVKNSNRSWGLFLAKLSRDLEVLRLL